MEMQLLLDGVKLMVLGTVTVFVFLILMVWMMNLMSRVLAPLAGFLEPPPAVKSAPKASNEDAKLAAAAVAAVDFYRNK